MARLFEDLDFDERSSIYDIGTEGDVALEMGRRFIGAELKKSYWTVANRNLQVRANSRQIGFNFDEPESE